MDHKQVVTELTQGKEFAMQLKIHLDNPSTSREFQEVLIHNILESYDNSLSLLTTHGLNPNGNESHLQAGMGVTRMESQVLFSDSQCKEHVDHEFDVLNHKDLSAKRMKKWKNQVQIRGDMGVEEALDDGYNWRKYGQKDIFGAKHPRFVIIDSYVSP
ncbi:hypothetical protein L1987_71086 [Smallanthus sonchifolius]|uniref:Uncharacterized protein n=1 Tax=Smallanthus sonchifolius TaxID=185202 RepID=A0ACB9ARS1_9ASTR|nr:hypothetical protein L1987_71086 [Smallanthus sonchifolius]